MKIVVIIIIFQSRGCGLWFVVFCKSSYGQNHALAVRVAVKIDFCVRLRNRTKSCGFKNRMLCQVAVLDERLAVQAADKINFFVRLRFIDVRLRFRA